MGFVIVQWGDSLPIFPRCHYCRRISKFRSSGELCVRRLDVGSYIYQFVSRLIYQCVGQTANHFGAVFWQELLDGINPDLHHIYNSLGPFYSWISTYRPIVTQWSWLLGANLSYWILLKVGISKYHNSYIYCVITTALWILGIWIDSHIHLGILLESHFPQFRKWHRSKNWCHREGANIPKCHYYDKPIYVKKSCCKRINEEKSRKNKN